MRDMLQCSRYHGNTANVLYGCHGFNLSKRLRSAFHAQLDFGERVTVLQKFLPMLDHGEKNVPPVSDTARNLIEQYRVWRSEELPTLFYCARALFGAIFRARGRLHVMEDYYYADDASTRLQRITAYMCAVNTKDTKHKFAQSFSAHSKHLRLDEATYSGYLAQLEEVDQVLRDYKVTHDITGIDDHRTPNVVKVSTVMETLFPVYIQTDWLRHFIQRLFKCYVTRKRYVLVTPKVAQTNMLVRTNTDNIF